MAPHVLIVVEDPGAANFVSPLPDALQLMSINCHLLAAGAAATQLQALGTRFDPLSSDAPDDLLTRLQPDLAVVGTSEDPDAYGLRLIDAARARGIPSLGLVDGPASPAFRFRGRGCRPTTHVPDRILVPDEATRQAYLALGFETDRVAAVGHPLYDRVRSERTRLAAIGRPQLRQRVFPTLPADRPLVLFLAELSSGLDPSMFRRSPDYTLHGRGRSDLRTDIVLEETIDALSSMTPRPLLAVRLHPKMQPVDLAQYLPESGALNHGGSAWEAVAAADVVVGLSTVLLVEAALLGSPTVSVLPRDAERALLPTIAAGITPCATRRDEIPQLLQQALSGQGRTEISQAFPSCAITRVVAQIEQLLA